MASVETSFPFSSVSANAGARSPELSSMDLLPLWMAASEFRRAALSMRRARQRTRQADEGSKAARLLGRELRVPSDNGDRFTQRQQQGEDAALQQLGPNGLLVERERRVELRQLLSGER